MARHESDAAPLEAKVKAVFSLHFHALLHTVLGHSASGASGTEGQGEGNNVHFSAIVGTATTPSKAAFDQLVRACPSEAWKHQDTILGRCLCRRYSCLGW